MTMPGLRSPTASAQPIASSFTAALILAILAALPAPAAEKAKDPGRESQKDLQKATALLKAGQQEKGIDALEAILRKYPAEAAAETAKELLRENGAGEEIRIFLVDRKFFIDGMKMKEGDVLDLAEKALVELRKSYKPVKPYFVKSSARLYLYDSQGRYKKATGKLTMSGDFGWTALSDEEKSIAGKIEWHFPQTGLNPKDRLLRIKNLLYHEEAHYLTAVHFGAMVPEVVNEGLSTFLESRLSTESYVGYRTTARQMYEGEARTALPTIAKLPDFLAMLSAPRGFGKGDAMIDRWYGLCYAIFDTLAEGEVGGQTGTLGKVLAALEALCRSRTGEIEKGKPRPVLENREALERLAKEVHGVSLEDFHKALVDRVMKRYKLVQKPVR